MKKSLQAFIALFIGLSLSVVGAAIPAQAAQTGGALVNPIVTAPGAVSGSTNPNPITFTFTTATTFNAGVTISFSTGWSEVSGNILPPADWSVRHPAIDSVSGFTPTNNSAVFAHITIETSSTVSAGSSITIVLPANSLNVGSGTTFTIKTYSTGQTVSPFSANFTDQATFTIGGGSSTVTFDANGGTGSTATQTASSQTALTANSYNRSGYTFAGWNTAADGSGTAYADGANYGFGSSITLYAQWTATLANTGFEVTGYLVAATSLAILGIALVSVSARRRLTSK